MRKTRVRFAPSPTGTLHAGNMRTALFNWLYAKNKGGDFIVRIEDTDTSRSERALERSLLGVLKSLGLTWDEGPDIGGPCGPYRQSERDDLYKTALGKLIKDGFAYQCYCTADELDVARKKLIAQGKPPRYTGVCRNLTDDKKVAKMTAGIEPSWRFKVDSASIEFKDGVRGVTHFKSSDIGDFILVRSNGKTAFYLASAVDDIEMNISDVIRGEDHLSNTPKQILIINALGATVPNYHHLPIILGADGQKLSKRTGSTDMGELLLKGYTPSAIVTSLAMLGWSGVNGSAPVSLTEMAKIFDIKKVSKAPSHFDFARLDHINGKAIKELSTEEFIKVMGPALERDGFPFDKFAQTTLHKIMDGVKDSIHNPFEAITHAEQFVELASPNTDAMNALDMPEIKAFLDSFILAVEEKYNNDDGAFKAVIDSLASSTGLKGKALFHPVRATITGRLSGPMLKDIFDTLGKDEIVKRINETKQRLDDGS